MALCGVLVGDAHFRDRSGGIRMRSTSARRELAFVFGVACAGLALVLVVAFTPWYTAVPPIG
ncbi:hypothetical protein Ato02nite_096860 [Paractinoplanes toevensis]|uniref:Uncharacterized protein n=1 Tax=Paractinoplanes toevensis TaxID=571911 RepID=A0A919WD06_9ACTN|nr:hypothetical protein Ato02nite_096860 [Actinoplanes toevensis]